MIEILDKPILEWQIKHLAKNNIKEIIICVGYLKEQIIDYIASGNKFDVHVAYTVEDEPLGTGGALKNTYSLLKDEKNGFFMINGDILTNINFLDLANGNNHSKLALVPLKSPYGIVEFDENLNVTGFEEKPNIDGKWINAGIYFYEEFLDNSFDDSSISLCESIDFQNEFSKFFAFNFCSFAIAGKAVISIFPFSGR